MSGTVLTKTYCEPPVSERDILRYAGAKNADGELYDLLRSCMNEAWDKLSYRVCYREMTLGEWEGLHIASRDLASHLEGCDGVLLFAATVGIELDRLIAKYGRLSPARALMLQAIGAERIEALCDAFCADLAKEYRTTARFSPGYGDLSLVCQKDVFAVLDCETRIGLTLTDSLLMLPTKSVTAIVGLKRARGVL